MKDAPTRNEERRDNRIARTGGAGMINRSGKKSNTCMERRK